MIIEACTHNMHPLTDTMHPKTEPRVRGQTVTTYLGPGLEYNYKNSKKHSPQINTQRTFSIRMSTGLLQHAVRGPLTHHSNHRCMCLTGDCDGLTKACLSTRRMSFHALVIFMHGPEQTMSRGLFFSRICVRTACKTYRIHGPSKQQSLPQLPCFAQTCVLRPAV